MYREFKWICGINFAGIFNRLAMPCYSIPYSSWYLSIYLSCPWNSWILMHTHIHTYISQLHELMRIIKFIIYLSPYKYAQQPTILLEMILSPKSSESFNFHFTLACCVFFSFEIQLQFTLLMELCIETISRNLAWFGEVFGVKLKLLFGVIFITGIGKDV